MNRKETSEKEFIVIMALLMALASVSIDAILPGLKEIGNAIGVTKPQNEQLLISMIFLGLGFGQLVTGSLSDSIGRKKVVYIGYAVFSVASFICIFSTNLEMMIAGRFLQGIGLSAPKSVSVSMTRDKYSGNHMARIMSFVTAMFLFAPILAPSIGKIITDHFGWQAIFISQLIFGFFTVLWLAIRQPETLAIEDRHEMRLSKYINASKEFLKNRQAVTFTIISGVTSAPFLAYISASKQIFQEQYGLIDQFPFIFSGLAIVIAIATFLNGKLVVKLGMIRLASIALTTLVVAATSYAILFFNGVNPSIVVVIIYFGLMLFTMGFVFGNVSALAMQRVGHIAGMGAALLGFFSTIIAVPIAIVIGRFVDTSVLPIFAGFSIFGILSLLLIGLFRLLEKKHVVSKGR